MSTRRKGREWALQMLFQADINPGMDIERGMPRFWRQQWTCKLEENEHKREQLERKQKTTPIEDLVAPLKIRLFSEQLVRGVLEHREQIDRRIVEYTRNWPLHRLGSVERSVLRLAFYELMFSPDVPSAVILNEAIDLTKYFGSRESGRFVNGVLDQFRRDTRRV